MSGQAPFARVGVLGLGLIGGSVALATRARFPDVEVRGCDDATRLAVAKDRAVVTDGSPDLQVLADCDLIVLAVPLASMLDVLEAVSKINTRALVTDVGSTKRGIVKAATDAGTLEFIGGHPMAGREKPGLDHADADLFVDRPWLLVNATAGEDRRTRLEGFVRGLGARPCWMDAEAHDRAVAFISHAPQVLAAALMAAADDGLGTAGTEIAGPAFGEMTRLASSPPDMWRSVLAENADFVTEALAVFAGHIPTAADLQSGNWVRDVLMKAGAARARWLDKN